MFKLFLDWHYITPKTVAAKLINMFLTPGPEMNMAKQDWIAIPDKAIPQKFDTLRYLSVGKSISAVKCQEWNLDIYEIDKIVSMEALSEGKSVFAVRRITYEAYSIFYSQNLMGDSIF